MREVKNMTDDEAREALAKLILDPMWRPGDNWPVPQKTIDRLQFRGFTEWYGDKDGLWQVRILPAGEAFLKG